MPEIERLSLSVGGEFAAAIREAAARSGLSPAEWVGRVLADRLGNAQAVEAGMAGRLPESSGAGLPAAGSDSPATRARPGEGRSAAEGLQAQSAWELVTDDTNTFTIALPIGWQSRAWVEPTPLMKYPMAQATSPDGGTTLFCGDSGIPMFVDPSTGIFPTPGTVLRPPTRALDFVTEWAQLRYSDRPGFRIVDSREDQQLGQLAVQLAQRLGSPGAWLFGARLTAEFTQDGRGVRAIFLATTRGVGPSWLAQVQGVISVEDPEPFVPAVLQLMSTLQSTPAEGQRLQQERTRSEANHQATMAQIAQNTAMMTEGHRQRMGNIQAQGVAFQRQMQERQATFDVGLQAWRQGQQAGDAAHAGYLGGLRGGGTAAGGDPAGAQQGYLNMIREEETVLDAQGDPHQVVAGSDRYFHNERTNTWIGIQEHQDIVEVTGDSRPDWTEGPVQR